MRPNFKPRQSLGQNFLTDPNTLRKIADALDAPSGASVVEIGPGTGALTAELAKRYPKLVAIEVDERAVNQLGQTLPKVDVRQQDVLQVSWNKLADELGEPLHVIGNLPYNLTTPILFDLIDARRSIEQAVIMVQKEVAERFVASPKTKAYGILSVQLQHFSSPEQLFDVSRNVFYPQPDVTSSIVRIRFDKPQSDVDDSWFKEVVRTAFGKRRKMLRNSLRAWTKDRGIDFPNEWGRRRPETLTAEEFAYLASYLQEKLRQEAESTT